MNLDNVVDLVKVDPVFSSNLFHTYKWLFTWPWFVFVHMGIDLFNLFSSFTCPPLFMKHKLKQNWIFLLAKAKWEHYKNDVQVSGIGYP